MQREPLYKLILNPVEDELPGVKLGRRGIDEKLASHVLVALMQEMIGSDAESATKTLRARGVAIEQHQVRAYFEGRHTPQRKIIVAIAEAFALPKLLMVHAFPWRLLAEASLTVADIERICVAAALKNDMPSAGLLRGQSRWHRPQRFGPPASKMEAPADPEGFWISIASYRSAEALGDFESMNYHRWVAVTRLASIATIPAVAANFRLLCLCMARLTRRVESPRLIWFSVDWIKVGTIMFGLSDEDRSPFYNVR